MRKLYCLLFGLLYAMTSAAQGNVSIGKKYSLPSVILGEKRDYWIYLPPGYDDTTYAPARYPVVYLLDGDANFHSFTGIQEILAQGPYASIPQMIVVGILNTDRTRDLTPSPAGRKAYYDPKATLYANSGGNERFIAFLQKELRPHIDSAYRTSGYNILQGHSFGGLTAVNLLLHHTRLFNAYVVIDPSLWWDQQLMLRQADSILPRKDFTGTNIYVAMAHKVVVPQDTTTDHPMAIRAFSQQLQRRQPQGLRWQFHYYPEDDHGTVPLPAAFDALKFIFSGHQVHVKQAVQDPSLITKHYAELSARLGFTFKPTERYLDWLGSYCLRIGRTDQAAAIFRMAADLYPQSKHTMEQLTKTRQR
ncbi:alpha/beta hydrolase [Chitinophaga varians]|uniref:alpha/beta hydrolase n=1 Tax=Chitinophaga varians TaxID=2202339 RepID=UPI00165FB78C|nr:alpha/beta hydrolase-fold protein [Chitinophaga varians]MBC9909937.1 alpha/beta hydrolase [Chitinophaga varians]